MYWSTWVDCWSLVRETWVQCKVVSYQKLKNWYLLPPCLTFSCIRYVSRVKSSNPGSYWKGSLWVTVDNGRQLYFLLFLVFLMYQTWYVYWFLFIYLLTLFFNFCHPLLFNSLFNSSTVWNESSLLLKSTWLMVRDLRGYVLIRILWNLVISSRKSVYFFFFISTSKVEFFLHGMGT